MGRKWCQTDPVFYYESQVVHVLIGFDAAARHVLDGIALEITVPDVSKLTIPEGQTRRKVYGADFALDVTEGDYGASVLIGADTPRLAASLSVFAVGTGAFPAMHGDGVVGEWLAAAPVEADEAG